MNARGLLYAVLLAPAIGVAFVDLYLTLNLFPRLRTWH